MNPKQLFLTTAIFLLASCAQQVQIRDSNLLNRQIIQE